MPGAAFDAEHGLWRSLRRTRKGGDYLFSLGFFGVAKKSKSPAAATERHRNMAKRQLQFKASSQAERRENETGVFGVRAQIPLGPRPALRVLRFAAQRNCDLTPKTIRPNPFPLPNLPPCLKPLWMRRGAQGKADQGPRLSEAKPSSSGTPPDPSTAGWGFWGQSPNSLSLRLARRGGALHRSEIGV